MQDRSVIENWILDYIRNYSKNHSIETKWREPVIGVADAHDPLYQELKTIIGPEHALPSDIVSGAESVIVYFVPFSEEIANSNIPREQNSREWDYACIETNQMLDSLNQYLYEKITEKGYHASKLPATYNFDQKLLTSDWSHRSSAYIAGIGTFGIHNMLITEQGCCGRIGSIITDWKIEPTKRSREEFCLYKAKGSCKKMCFPVCK